jgi:hypothetical protein
MRKLACGLVFSLLVAAGPCAEPEPIGGSGVQGIGGQGLGGDAPPTIPEPAAVAAFGVGAVVIGYAIRRRRGK